jgi:N-terminal domain of anti-restriction factor ArdC
MKCKSQSKGADTMKHTTSPSPIRSEEPKRQTAKEAIAANIQSLIQQLEAGHSEALTAYLNAMSRFHNYSFGNILEIARQKPDATRVAGLYAWNQIGRKVKKGERGIRILAPIVGIRRTLLNRPTLKARTPHWPKPANPAPPRGGCGDVPAPSLHLCSLVVFRKGSFRQRAEPGTRSDFDLWRDFAKLVNTEEGSL